MTGLMQFLQVLVLLGFFGIFAMAVVRFTKDLSERERTRETLDELEDDSGFERAGRGD